MKLWLKALVLSIITGTLACTLTACAGSPINKLVESVIDVKNEFNSIVIDTSMADISILPSEDGNCKVIANDLKKIVYTAEVEGNTLKIKLNDQRKWYQKLFNWHTPTLTLYIPAKEYGALNIDASTGNIRINHAFTFASVDIKISTGDVSLTGVNSLGGVNVELSTGDVLIDTVTCTDFTSSGSTGDINVSALSATGSVAITRSSGNVYIKESTVGADLTAKTSTGNNDVAGVVCGGNFNHEVSTGRARVMSITCCDFTSYGDTGNLKLENVIAGGKFDIKRSTGDVKFAACDAAEIYVSVDTGNVTGTLRTSKIFIVKTSTGNVEVPESVTGGKCKITTSTGDVEIAISDEPLINEEG